MEILFCTPSVKIRPRSLVSFYQLLSSKQFTVRVDGEPVDYSRAKSLGEAEFGRMPALLALEEQNHLRGR